MAGEFAEFYEKPILQVDRLCYTYTGIVCKTGRRFYQAPNSLTTITIVSFFYAFFGSLQRDSMA